MPLSVIIVGAGIAGLTAAISLHRSGCQVRVFEASSIANPIGAAVSLPPNGVRILQHIGFDFGRAQAVQVHQWETLDGISGNHLAHADLLESATLYGAPWYIIHRVDLHKELMRLAEPIEVQLGSRVVEVSAQEGWVKISTGPVHTADLIVGADGLSSIVRQCVAPPEQSELQATGSSAFRFLIPTAVLEQNAKAAAFIGYPNPTTMLFADTSLVDQERHLVCYPCRGGQIYNFVGIHPSPENNNLLVHQGFKTQLIQQFSHFDSKLVEIMKLSDDVKCWKLYSMKPLPSWQFGKALLIGDAAHPMLPFGGQGACQAMEDGLALGMLLSPLEHKEDFTDISQHISQRLKLFDQVRRRRATRVQILSSVRAHREMDAQDSIRPYLEQGMKVPACFKDRVTHDAGYSLESDILAITKLGGCSAAGKA